MASATSSAAIGTGSPRQVASEAERELAFEDGREELAGRENGGTRSERVLEKAR